VFAFTQQNLAPLAIAILVAVLGGAIALFAQSRRDLDSSILRERNGRATGSPRLRSPLALAWRQQWPSVVGWAVGGALLGSLAGSLAGRIADTADLAPTLQKLLELFVPGGRGQLIDLLVAAIIGIAGVLAAGAGVQTILRARGEESDGRAELVLAAPVRRSSWLLAWVSVAVIAATLVALATGLVAGLSFAGASDARDRLWSSLAAGVAQLPAALTFVAITTLVFVILPRATVALGWGLLALGFIIGQFGALMQFPDWLRKVSPFAHTPSIPANGVDWSGAIVLVVISAALIGVSLALVRERQLTS
jgi:ABC-2 type transport system permease protein